MTIPVSCACGQSFKAKPQLAGKRVKCPSCGGPIDVPRPTLTPLDDDPLGAVNGDDPLGLGGFDDRTMGPAADFAATSTPFTSTPSYVAKKATGGQKSNLPVILAIVGGVCALGFVMVVILAALLLPAIQAARQAARRAQEENRQRAVARDVSSAVDSGSAVAGWREYSVPSGAYTVKLPGTPKLQNRVQPSANGLVTINMAVVDLGDDVGAYFVAYNDLPIQGMTRSDKRKVLDGSVNGMTTSMNVSVESKRDFDQYGGMVREVAFQGTTRGQSLIGTCRIVLANDRLYQLMWLGPEGDRPEEDLQVFFASFQPGGSVELSSSQVEPVNSASPGSDVVMQVDSPGPTEPSSPPVTSPPAISPPAIPVAPPVPRPPSFQSGLRSLDELDESDRQKVYRHLAMSDRMLASRQQQIDALRQSGGASDTMLKQLQSSIDQTKKSLLESASRIFRISEADAESIRQEGLRKGWR